MEPIQSRTGWAAAEYADPDGEWGSWTGNVVWVFESEAAASAAMDVFQTDAAFQCLVASHQANWISSENTRQSVESVPWDPTGLAVHGDRQIVRGQHNTYTDAISGAQEQRYFANTWIQIGRAITYIAPQADDPESIAPGGHVAHSIAAAAAALDAAFGATTAP